MKKINKIISIIFALFVALILVGCNQNQAMRKNKSSSFKPLDEISKYQITIDPKDDGTLDFFVSITWKVLDSSSEGPLEWVKIGVPNYHISNIKAISSNIDNIEYLSDGGAYVRIDFDRAYYANEELTFNYSYNQDYMYTVANDVVNYTYTPGWFDDIKVKTLIINWNTKDVKNEPGGVSFVTDSYYMWTKALDYGEKYTINVSYDIDAFANIDLNKKASSSYMRPGEAFATIAFFILVVLLIIATVYLVNKNRDKYMDYRGFRGDRLYSYSTFYLFHYVGFSNNGAIARPGTSGGSSGGGGHSCACACACAGGGRAGCSRKYYYKDKQKENGD